MRLSYSSISTYQSCPLQYKFQYVDKIPRKPSYALSFGASLHSAVEYFYSVPYPKPPSLDELLGQLKKVWRSDGYSSKSEEEAHFSHAVQVLTLFYQDNIADFRLPLALEHHFEIKLDGYTLSGKIDKVDKLPEGGLEIVDFKTNRRLPPLEKLKEDLQLSIYHLAAQKIWGMDAAKLTLYFLIPNQKMSSSRTPEQIEEARKLIGDVAENIAAEQFEPRENPLCPWCDYQSYCPLYKHKYPPRPGGAACLEDIEKTVEEYAELKKEERELSAKICELQEKIHRYCEEHNLSRLYGEGAVITRIAKEKYSYDLQRVREILEPLQLWERVVKVESTLLRGLIENKEIDEETKAALEAARRLENISYALYLKENRSQDERA